MNFGLPGAIVVSERHTCSQIPKSLQLFRDDYVDINWGNLGTSKCDIFRFISVRTKRSSKFSFPPGGVGQFAIHYAQDIYGLPYDFASILHPGGNDYGKDETSWTVRPKPKYQNYTSVMGQRNQPSPIDI